MSEQRPAATRFVISSIAQGAISSYQIGETELLSFAVGGARSIFVDFTSRVTGMSSRAMRMGIAGVFNAIAIPYMNDEHLYMESEERLKEAASGAVQQFVVDAIGSEGYVPRSRGFGLGVEEDSIASESSGF